MRGWILGLRWRSVLLGAVVCGVGMFGCATTVFASGLTSSSSGGGTGSCPAGTLICSWGPSGEGSAGPVLGLEPSSAPVGWLVSQRTGLCQGPVAASLDAVAWFWQQQACTTPGSGSGSGLSTQLLAPTSAGELEAFPNTGAPLCAVGGEQGSKIQSASGWSENCSVTQRRNVWNIDPQGHLQNTGTGQCMDVENNGTTAGTPDINYPCWNQPSGSNQNFDFITRMTNIALPLMNPVTGKCLAVPSTSWESPPMIAACSGEPQQLWKYEPTTGYLRVTPRPGVEICPRTETPYRGLMLGTCKRSSEKWRFNPNGTISNQENGKCLDIPNGTNTNEAAVIEYECKAGAENQHFTQVSVANTGSEAQAAASARAKTAEACQANQPVNLEGLVLHTLSSWKRLGSGTAQLGQMNLPGGGSLDSSLSVPIPSSGVIPSTATAVLLDVAIESPIEACATFAGQNSSTEAWHTEPQTLSAGGQLTNIATAAKIKPNQAHNLQHVLVTVPVGAEGRTLTVDVTAASGAAGLLKTTITANAVGYLEPLTDAEAISELRFHFYSWGKNNYGQVGDGTSVDKETPVLVKGLQGIETPILASGGPANSIALLRNGTVATWGDNLVGELGNGKTDALRHESPEPVPNLNGIIRIAAGSGSDYALSANGQVYAWGGNTAGQLCDGTSTTKPSPTPMVLPAGFAPPALAIAASTTAVYVLDNRHRVWACGSNGNGQLGNGGVGGGSAELVMVQGLPAQPEAVGLTAGKDTAYALMSDGTVYGWGYNEMGEAVPGLGMFNVSTPTIIPGLHAVSAVYSAYYTGFAADQFGNVSSWASNVYGMAQQPGGAGAVGVAASTLSNVTEIAGSPTEPVAFARIAGTVASWGRVGQIAMGRPHGIPGIMIFPPPEPGAPAPKITRIGAGYNTGYAIGYIANLSPGGH
jgi:hypothetical protein